MRLLTLFCLLASARAAPDAAIRGIVRDSQNGEPLARVRVLVLNTAWQTLTGPDGRFEISSIAPGTYTLQVSTVGYRLAAREFTLAAGATQEFEVALSPDSFRRSDSIEVRADPFETLRADAVPAVTMVGSELKNLASVLADDPLRAVQALPGVSSGDDFNSRFSLRGSDYDRVGLYLDDVLLHQPFHTMEGQNSAGGSLTIFNGDMVEDMALYAGAFPSRYGDRTAGALDVRMREGSRRQTSVRGTASASNAGLMAEGPLGAGRGSWMASLRKSYLEYIVRRTTTDPSMAFGFWDAQARLSYDVRPRHNVSLTVFEGRSALDRSDARDRLGLNSLMTAAYHFTFLSAAWKFTPGENFVVTSRGAAMREKYDNANRDGVTLGAGRYGEWVWSSAAAWTWSGRNTLDAGAGLRQRRDDGFADLYQFNPFALRRLDQYAGTGLLAGGYLQQSVVLASGRIHLAAGGRWDRDGPTATAVLSPQASLSLVPWPSTRIQFGWGGYAQFPELRWLYSRFGGLRLRPERSIHFLAALERRLDQRTRLRLEAYNRLDRDLLFRPAYDPRLIGSAVFVPPADALVYNSLRGYARGVEFLLQRRTANRFTGWLSYALGYARVRDAIARVAFPSDTDQRHTVNLYGSYRIRSTVNLSARWLYGSGFPIPGFFRRSGELYYLSDRRNQVRLGSYQRTDVRINKAWIYNRWKLTLYGEVVNLFNRDNRRYDAFNGFNARTGQAYPAFNTMFPILPSAGVVLEY